MAFYSTGSQVLVHMLADHSDIPILFKLAADWELDDCRNVEKARNHLKNGLQIHKKCAMLYLDLFRVQLIYINNKIIEEQEMMLRIPIVRLIRLEDMEYQQTSVNLNTKNDDEPEVFKKSCIKEEKFGKKWLGVVLKEATVSGSGSGSVTLWELRMRMHLVWDEVGEATAILDEANLALQGDAALPLWQHMLLYWLANDPTKHKVRVNEFLKKASNMENQPAICNHFRVIWLGWIVLKMAKRSPPCLQLHHKMIEYEKMQEDCNEACLRIYYVLACIHFGTDNKEIWLDYFRFEKEYGKPGQMGDLYNDACSYLNKSLVEQFKEEYNQLNK